MSFPDARVAAVTALACAACASASFQARAVAPVPVADTPRAVAFVDISVVPMDAPRVLAHHTVVVRDGLITTMGPAGDIRVPGDAVEIDGRGRYLAPGLIDMHVHVRSRDLAAYTGAGITSVRNMWGWDGLQQVAARIDNGEIDGPAIYSASPGLDGPPAQWPETVLIQDPRIAAEAVHAQADAGWRFIKVYQNLRADVYDAIVAAGRQRNMRLVGHVGPRVGLARALAAGQASIEHLTGYEVALSRVGGTNAAAWASIDRGRVAELARSTRAAGTWNCPTLAIYREFARQAGATEEQIVENRRLVVGALHEAGARILAGSDAGIDVVAPGSSLHVELSELVASGLSPYDALSAATHGAAEFLGATADIGSISVGRRADLLVLASNPLDSLDSVSRPTAIMVRGRWKLAPR